MTARLLFSSLLCLTTTRRKSPLPAHPPQNQTKTGIAASLAATGEQWDFPNGWPPLQQLLAAGAAAHGGARGRRLARRVARAWVRRNYETWKLTGHMHEKYDVRGGAAGGGDEAAAAAAQGGGSSGGGVEANAAAAAQGVGGGGEYAPQIGFGWSNGVLLELLTGGLYDLAE